MDTEARSTERGEEGKTRWWTGNNSLGFRFGRVVDARGSEDDDRRAQGTGAGEQQQEDTVQHHGHVLPVFDYLKRTAYGGQRGGTDLFVFLLVPQMVGDVGHTLDRRPDRRHVPLKRREGRLLA